MEFLIRRTDGDWFDLHPDKFDEALRPTSYLSKRACGFGDYRIEVEGCEVSFSYEDPGILVSFEGSEVPESKALRIVEEIAIEVGAVTGQSVAVVAL